MNGTLLGRIISTFILLIIVGFILAPLSISHAEVTDPKDPAFQLLPTCDPKLFPNNATTTGGGPCGFGKFQQLIVNVIKWLLYIIIPIGFCLIGWAGFKIMTSAGNGEAMSQAYGMIKIVVVGILIAALSYIIIVNIFNVLNVQNVKIRPII